jgi:inner membrane protein
MFIFGHVGITVGSAILVSKSFLECRRRRTNKFPQPSDALGTELSSKTDRSYSKKTGLKALSGFLDIRLLIIGSMLPDILDKPLALLPFGNGRSITHTALVILVILVAGLLLSANFRKTWLLAIAIGMVTHFVLDSMWLSPQTSLWPFDGLAFPTPAQKIGLGQIGLWWSTLTSNRSIDISEGIGLLIVLGLVWILIRERKVKSFLKSGRI